MVVADDVCEGSVTNLKGHTRMVVVIVHLSNITKVINK